MGKEGSNGLKSQFANCGRTNWSQLQSSRLTSIQARPHNIDIQPTQLEGADTKKKMNKSMKSKKWDK